MEVHGYVYKITNKETGEYYIGSRVANIRHKRQPENDFWKYYFTSSSTIHDLISLHGSDIFSPEIVFCDHDKDEVYWKEQEIIRENISNPKCLNVHYQDRATGKKIFSTHGMDPWNKGLSSVMKGIPRTPDTIEKISTNRKGKGLGIDPWNKGRKEDRPHVIANIKAGIGDRTGINNPFYGRDHSAETKERLRVAQSVVRVCPHCGKEGKGSAMIRWHFDNCKHK